MALLDIIQTEIIAAMKAKDELRLNTLRSLKLALERFRIDQQKPVTGQVEISILNQQAKQRQDSIAAFDAGNRPLLAAKERAELAIILTFLPPQATDEEMDAAVATAVQDASQSGVTGNKAMGAVMKLVQALLVGKTYDGKIIAEKVKAKL